MTGAILQHAPDRIEARPVTGLKGRIAIPGDKSISHRALIIGAMAEGETRIEGLLEGDDVLRTAAALSALGVRIARVGPHAWSVRGGSWRSPDSTIDCGNSGTAARLLLGALAGRPVEAELDGDESLRARPMGRILDPLRAAGARISPGGRLPVRVKGGTLAPILHRSPVPSAQVKTGLLLAGLGGEGATLIEPSQSRDHGENLLRAFGARVETLDRPDGHLVRIEGRQGLAAIDLMVPGDPSSAAFPLVAALITPDSEVTVHGLLVNRLRTGLFVTLAEMGADLVIANRRIVGHEEVADVTARSSALIGVEVPADRAPSMIDEYPALAMAAACAVGQTAMYGLGELRVKECDRLSAIVAGLRACGVSAGTLGDSLLVDGCDGRVAGGGRVHARHDHRIAMSFLVLGLASRRTIAVDSASMIATSFPDFVPLMRSIGADLSDPDTNHG